MKNIELKNNIGDCFRLLPMQKKALERLGIKTIEDLLFHFPVRYSDISKIYKICDLVEDQLATVYGRIGKIKIRKSFRTKIPMAEAIIEDSTGKLKIIWFHQAYIAKMVHEGSLVGLQGKISGSKTSKAGLYMSNPEIEKTKDLPIDANNTLFTKTSEIFGMPIYPESRGITSRWFYHTIQKIFTSGALDKITDSIPEDILKKYNLPSLKTALIWIHSPKKESDARVARKRFAFEEIFYIQLSRQQSKKEYNKRASFCIDIDKNKLEQFITRFSFELTESQQQAISIITSDMSKDKPMLRLLEGDVGSGKTAVAATVSFAIISSRKKNAQYENLQVAYMAPTEVLAKQLFESFAQYFAHLPIQIGLVTGTGCKKFPSKIITDSKKTTTSISRAQLLKWVANGETNILIGTHSLIQKIVTFKNLACVIVDEQHRFGTEQRAKLAQKSEVSPHFLSMTATPIPRTLALTIYGDLDLTLLDKMPLGRKPVITEIVLPNAREEIYKKIHKELERGKQVYIICPRIDEPDPDKEQALLVKSVKEEAERLKRNVFQKYTIGILHGKMPPRSITPSIESKESIMRAFANHEIDILVATSMIEVGINIPNATIIVIEGAERFGLAQLHQLRGRVLRSTDQAYCYIFADTKTEKTSARLKALKTAKNGFELAELDLMLRGAGELVGKKQWGISDIGMEAIKNIKMVEAAQTEAKKIIEKDSDLKKYPFLKKQAKKFTIPLHFE
ncbi:ATP-dependent DNA helicase RecG [Patescibacteria group bacterium]|nr:ATP-dependent DNA helicase RecG [Patescibacteria group bacterium]